MLLHNTVTWYFQPDPLPEDIEHALLSPEEKQQLLFMALMKNRFYWPLLDAGYSCPIASNIVCLDYSAVKYGRLVAYRLDHETLPQAHKFTWVRVERTER